MTSTVSCPGTQRLMEHHAVIDGANEHGPLADGGIVEFVLALGVRLRVGDRLHAALQLDQDDVHAGGDGVAVGAVVDDAGDRAGGGAACESKEKAERERRGECSLHHQRQE